MNPDTELTLRIARAMRTPLTAYQADLVGTCNGSTPTARPPTVVVLMPRQTGKTSTLFRMLLARGYRRRDYRAAYTAQRGTVVTERFTGDGDGWMATLDRSPLAGLYAYRRSAGNERITHRRTGSFIRGFPPVDGALRSLALDCVILDEAQEHSPTLGAALDATVVPTFTTRPHPQLIVAGTAGSPGWWADYYAAAAAGRHTLFEVGTWPDEADPADETVWQTHHPGLRAGLTTLDTLRQALAILGPDQFAREYGNRWDAARRTAGAFPIDAWDALPATPAPADDGTRVYALDITPTRDTASVVGVQGQHVHLLTQCHPAHLPAVLAQQQVRKVWALTGQRGTLDQLRVAGIRGDVLDVTDYRAGCQQLHDAIRDGTLTHAHNPQLREALAAATPRWHGDTWVLSARASGADITAAVAATLAWRVSRRVAPVLL